MYTIIEDVFSNHMIRIQADLENQFNEEDVTDEIINIMGAVSTHNLINSITSMDCSNLCILLTTKCMCSQFILQAIDTSTAAVGFILLHLSRRLDIQVNIY